ncbi:nucleotidyltransferase family protein [Radiobacillus sp. PE A8.2]|uniref:nucleotidyltransferase family protein n=1 Tax=Radiobacillus sp. PE A8.2 TaxID=3380349 RepID=UPI00388D53E3
MAEGYLREYILNELKQIVNDTLIEDGIKVYLFGSWARNEEKHSSDIDIAIEAKQSVSPTNWTELIDKVEESTIPYKVDIVDLNGASNELVKKVKTEGILWSDSTKD